MNPIKETINARYKSRPLQSDEYLNESDGLIYCSKCRTPRQCKIEHDGQYITLPVRCLCQKESDEQEEAEFQKRQRLIRIEHLKANGLQDKCLHDYTFANDKGYNADEMKKAHRYVTEWDTMRSENRGLLLWGNVGTGKTFIAACIADALIEKGVPVLMTNFSKILNTLTPMFSVDRNAFIDSLNQYSLLIIDDLGIERNSEFALEQVFSVIDARYRSNKPLIITTNLTIDEMNHADLAHTRIYDRILERCTPLMVNNQNIRKLNAEKNLKEARKLLSAKRAGQD